MFQKWIILGCPTYGELRDKLEPDVHGRVPHKDHISQWAVESRWHERRDEILAKASAQMEQELVKVTVQMWKEHADAAAKVRREALAYIMEKGFDSSASAIQAIKWAQEEERKTRGAEAFVAIIKNSSNEDLLDKARRLVDRHASTVGEDFVDAIEESEPAEPDD